MKDILVNFPISNAEYKNLESEFGRLAKYASWQLLRKNAKNNHTDDFDDINQELLFSLVYAGSYYKRQNYIDKSLNAVKKHVSDNFIGLMVEELEKLWANRTRHGANRQKFGYHQEKLLDRLVASLVPPNQRINKDAELKIDAKFERYCKAINWNKQKSIGRKITREKRIRSGLVSLSANNHLI